MTFKTLLKIPLWNGKFDVAKEYITYRYQKALDNRKNTIDDRVLSLLNNDNEDM